MLYALLFMQFLVKLISFFLCCCMYFVPLLRPFMVNKSLSFVMMCVDYVVRALMSAFTDSWFGKAPSVRICKTWTLTCPEAI